MRYESTKQSDSSQFGRAYGYEKYENPLGFVLSDAPSSPGPPDLEGLRTAPPGGARGVPDHASEALLGKSLLRSLLQINPRNPLTLLQVRKIGVLLCVPRFAEASWPLALHFVWLLGGRYGG